MAVIDISAHLDGGSEALATGRMIFGATAAITRPKPSDGFGPQPTPKGCANESLGPLDRPQSGSR
jgi:hypothetical protein